MGRTRWCALAACLYLNAGCGSSPSNFYDAPSPGTGAPNGGTGAASGGANSAAGSGSAGSGGQSANTAGAGGMGHFGDLPCGPVKDVTGGATGPLGTMGPACLRVTGDIAGWGCSNFEGRSLKVNGQPVTCAELPLPNKIDGAYYFDISAGTFEYASFYWF